MDMQSFTTMSSPAALVPIVLDYATGGGIATSEPSTLALLGTGLFGLATLFRLKRMAKPRASGF